MRASVVRWLALWIWGIDTDRLACYLSDPEPYHDKVLDPEDVMD